MPFLRPLYADNNDKNQRSPDISQDYLRSVPAKMYDKARLYPKNNVRSNASPVVAEPSPPKHL
jgi:hypothetical protein